MRDGNDCRVRGISRDSPDVRRVADRPDAGVGRLLEARGLHPEGTFTYRVCSFCSVMFRVKLRAYFPNNFVDFTIER